MRDYDATVKNLREAAKGLLFDAMPYRASVMKDAADAIEELLGQHEADAKEISWLKKCVQDLPKPPRWISVEERLPPVYKNVLSCDKYGLVKENYMISDKSWSVGYHITHWMPLPAPPKGVE